MATTDGMTGDGYYDDHSEYQRKVAETGSALVRACVDAVPLPAPGTTFVVADYGASTGRNSIAAVRNAIDQVRSRRADQPAAALHNDLPTNDWNEFFANLQSSPDSYLPSETRRALPGSGVLPLVSAISFFEPAAPAGSVHVGVSFSAAHWLRSQPTAAVPEGFYFCEATGAARAALAAQADADWTAFLEARASDLASGGRLLVQMVGSEPDAHVTARRLLRAMADVAAAMAAGGDLDPGAVERYVLAVYARTPDEARAPLERAGSPLADAFTVVECRTDPVPNPYFEKWRSDHDDAAYAKAYAAFVRGFTESSLRNNLFAPGSRGKPVDDLVTEFFDRLTTRFAADPERDRFEDWTLTVVLTRK